MKIKHIKIVLSLMLLLAIQSCGINSNLMLKTPKDYVFDKLNVDSANATKNEYIIQVNDIIKFQFFTNKGQKVLDIVTTAGGNQRSGLTSVLSYTIMADSLVKLPTVGEINIVGKTIREAELFIENEFKNLYVDPFVQLAVTNKRVLIFPGNGGTATVVYLKNNNTTLLEALALAGGLAERGRASRIKLMRGDKSGNKKVYLIDLSTIEGLQMTDLVVQNGDYIYVEPVPELGKELLKEIAPIVSLISSAAVIISILTLFK